MIRDAESAHWVLTTAIYCYIFILWDCWTIPQYENIIYKYNFIVKGLMTGMSDMSIAGRKLLFKLEKWIFEQAQDKSS